MIVLRLLPLFVIILFILFQKCSIRITKKEALTVKLNFSLLAVLFTEEKIKKIRLGRFVKSFRQISGIIKSAKYLISKSDFLILDNEKLIDNLIFIYLKANARSLTLKDADVDYSDNSQELTKIDVTAYFYLVHLIISALIFLYYMVKNKVKRVIKNV